MYQYSFAPPHEQQGWGGGPRIAGMGWRKRKRKDPEPGFPKNCDICKVVLNGKYEYDGHMNGKRHMKELRKNELSENLEKERAENEGSGNQTNDFISVNPTTSRRMCSLCSVEFSSAMTERSHVQGRRHQQNIRKSMFGLFIQNKSKVGEQFKSGRCEVCKVS